MQMSTAPLVFRLNSWRVDRSSVINLYIDTSFVEI